jgi:hypothetical protein
VTFNDAASMSQRAEAFENVLDPSDLRVLKTLSFTSDNKPVSATFQPVDNTVLATLVATLL